MYETQRTIIRRFQAGDIESIHHIESDENVMKTTGPGRSQTFNESEKRLQKILSNQQENNILGYWAAIDKESDILMGWFMLLRLENGDIELGFMIAKNFWGGGYAYEVSSYLCKKAMEEFGIRRIIAKTLENNKRSINVLEKIGFKKRSSHSCDDSLLQFFLE